MNMQAVWLSAYIVIALFAIAMTYREQKRRGNVTPMFRIIGFGLSLVWPVLLFFVGISIYLRQRALNGKKTVLLKNL